MYYKHALYKFTYYNSKQHLKKATTLHQQCPDIFLSLAVAVAVAVTDAAIVVVLDVVDVFALLMIQLAKNKQLSHKRCYSRMKQKTPKKAPSSVFFLLSLLGEKSSLNFWLRSDFRKILFKSFFERHLKIG